MKICYVGPCDAVTAAGFLFERGVPVDVPAEVAGRPPASRLASAMVELAAAVAADDAPTERALRDELAGLDRGEGLLAQATFARADVKSKSTSTVEVASQEDDR